MMQGKSVFCLFLPKTGGQEICIVFFTGSPSSYSISALEDSEVLYIDNDNLEKLYLSVPKLERYFRILLKNAYVASQRRIILAINQTAEERYIDFIKRYPDLEQRVPQYLVASYLGITPEFLSKIRRKIVHRNTFLS